MGAMVKTFAAIVVVLGSAAVADAQIQQNGEQLRNSRIWNMEAVLQRAVSAGAESLLRKVSDVVTDQPSLSSIPEVHGFPLPGHGLFFYVQVPRLQMPILWSMLNVLQGPDNRQTAMLVQQLSREAQRLQGPEGDRLRALVREMEMQLATTQRRPALGSGGVSAAAVVAEASPAAARASAPANPEVISDPQSVYTREIKTELLRAMLENGQTLALGNDEWLTVAARGDERRNPLQPGDEGTTWMARVKGSDLAAIRAGTLSLDEARKRVEITEN